MSTWYQVWGANIMPVEVIKETEQTITIKPDKPDEVGPVQ